MNDRRPHAPVVHLEQAVYGSFAFRADGYAVLAQSPGCRPEWLADFRAACQNLGERPAGIPDTLGLFALRLPSGPWAIVGVSPQGRDDRGRPGALAFHGLFLPAREYRKARHDPFTLAGALRSDWSAETRDLPALAWPVSPVVIAGEVDPSAARIAAILTRKRRVALESSDPIDDLARQVWAALPDRVRARCSVATLAFGNGNRFDLLAAPKLAGLALDASYLDPGAEKVPRPIAPHPSRRVLLWFGVAAVLAGVSVGLALRGDGDEDDLTTPPAPTAPKPSPSPVPVVVVPDDDHDDDPAERVRVAEALVVLADRFGIETSDDPAIMMERLAEDLRYQGPFLSEPEVARLKADPGHDAALALHWDALARRFAADRPLPANFRRRTPRGQLVALAWSFHSERAVSDSRRSTSELAQALAESLAVDVSLRPSPLTARFPALTSYLAFLGRLPRE